MDANPKDPVVEDRPVSTPRVVLMFPGAGAQYPGAGRELLSQPRFRRAVNECFSLMPADVPRDLRAVMFESDPSDAAAATALQRPVYALPALFTLEYGLAKLWESWGVKPAAVIGHSAGDYAAACCAGVMSLADAVSVTVLRAQLIQTAAPGAMLSVDLAETALRTLMAGLDLDVAVVNAPDLCVASGPLRSICQLEERLAGQGVQGRRVHIDMAAHSHLLDGVLGTFRERVSRIRLQAPTIPFMSNLAGTWADAQALTDPEYWVRHLRNTVRFSDGMRKLLEMRDAILVEAGPGQGLCALARQNSGGEPRTILPSTCKAQEANGDLAVMLTTAGALWAHGMTPDWQALRGPGQPRRVSVPTCAFDHQRHWIEPGVVAQREHAPAPKTADATQAASARPLNPVERVLADAWRELLGVGEIAGDDDFFALGGHSLAAVRLLARIRKQFAVDLPLATLIQAPTLARLAAVVAQSGGAETATVAGPNQTAPETIPPARPARRPLFCVHGAGGNVLNFKIISDRLGSEQAFYGLQAQGVDGRLPPLASVEEMAAQYVQAIRSVDPTGPYRLAGYSAGGLIAFEMAQQLEKAGAQVALLAMFDTLSSTKRKFSFLRKLWLARHWSLGFAVEWPARRRREKLAQAHHARALEKLSPGESLPPELVDFHLHRNFIAVRARYKPDPYDGSLVLFRAAQADLDYLQAGRSLGWNEHIRGDIRVVDVAGSHLSMLSEPGVSQLIDELRKELVLLDDTTGKPAPGLARHGALPGKPERGRVATGTAHRCAAMAAAVAALNGSAPAPETSADAGFETCRGSPREAWSR
jgi:thioesterase domain-containing protein/malonyl CoA-acyl carrier protein transacylase/acyl carrier protein